MSSDNFDPYEYVREQLDQCNHTELYQLCRQRNLAAYPSMSIDELIEVFLTGTQQAEPSKNVFDTWRNGLTGFVFEHWKVLEPQLTCPIRSKNPQSCWGCLDTQVTACLNGTAPYEQSIRLHRK